MLWSFNASRQPEPREQPRGAELGVAAMLHSTGRRSRGERARLAVSKGTVFLFFSLKKRLIWQRERENGEEVPDCTCFSSHEKVAVWQRITY